MTLLFNELYILFLCIVDYILTYFVLFKWNVPINSFYKYSVEYYYTAVYLYFDYEYHFVKTYITVELLWVVYRKRY